MMYDNWIEAVVFWGYGVAAFALGMANGLRIGFRKGWLGGFDYGHAKAGVEIATAVAAQEADQQ